MLGPREFWPQISHNSILMAYWILARKVTWQTAGARRTHWPSLVSLSVGNKSPLWKMPSLPQRAKGDILFTRVKESRTQEACINKPLYCLTNLLSKDLFLFRFLTNEHPNLSVFVLSIIYKCGLFVCFFCLKSVKSSLFIISRSIIYDLPCAS